MNPIFIGEIRAFPYRAIPEGWAECAGQVFSTTEYPALFALLSNRFGGDGQDNFALPDLRGRLIVSCESSITDLNTVGIKGGTETVTLTTEQMPPHQHSMSVSSDTANLKLTKADTSYLADMNHLGMTIYGYTPDVTQNTTLLNENTVSNTGGNQEHYNMMPFQALTYCIAITGSFPFHS